MMTAATDLVVLGERIERLTGEDAECALPGYRSRAERIRSSVRFEETLRRVRALADENRLLAVAMLKSRTELCACEIQAATGLTHATVSHHMSVLMEAGLVDATRHGKWMYYRLRDRRRSLVP